MWLLAIAAFMTIAAATTAAAPALSTFTRSLRTFTGLALLDCGQTLDRGRVLLPGFLPRRTRLLLAILMLLALALFLPATVWRSTFLPGTFWSATFLASTFLTAALAGLLIAAAVVAFRPAVAAMFVAAAVRTASAAPPTSPVVALLFTVRTPGLLVARTRLGGLRLDFGFAR